MWGMHKSEIREGIVKINFENKGGVEFGIGSMNFDKFIVITSKI